jgi:hypothetical protein
MFDLKLGSIIKMMTSEILLDTIKILKLNF